MRAFVPAIASIMLFATAVYAQEFAWRDREGKSVPESDFQKAKNGFGALVLLSDDADVFDKWQQPEPPNIRTVEKVTVGDIIHVLVIFAGAKEDADGNAHITYDATVLKPDGSPYSDTFKDIEALKGPAAPSMNLQLSPGAVGIRIEPQDPAGVYTVEIIARDNVRKVELKLKQQFTVEK